MISQEISWWDISLVQVIQVIQLIQVIQVGLVHLWSDFRVIWWKTSVFKAFLTNNSRGEGEISPILLLFFLYRCFVKRGRGTTFSLICKVEFDAAPNKTANLFDTFSFTYGGITKDRNPQRLFFVQDFCLRHISYWSQHALTLSAAKIKRAITALIVTGHMDRTVKTSNRAWIEFWQYFGVLNCDHLEDVCRPKHKAKDQDREQTTTKTESNISIKRRLADALVLNEKR